MVHKRDGGSCSSGMHRAGRCLLAFLLIGILACCGSSSDPSPGVSEQVEPNRMRVDLPVPVTDGTLSVEAAIGGRRSVRAFTDDALPLEALSQLLWAAQGVVDDGQRRTVPSAGALYPLSVWVVAGAVDTLDQGLYLYLPESHQLAYRQAEGAPVDLRGKLQAAALDQTAIGQAPAVLILAADVAVSSARYGDRAERFVHMEAGHASQNLYLQTVSLGLGTVAIGGYEDDRVLEAVPLPKTLVPLYLMPVGWPSVPE